MADPTNDEIDLSMRRSLEAAKRAVEALEGLKLVLQANPAAAHSIITGDAVRATLNSILEELVAATLEAFSASDALDSLFSAEDRIFLREITRACE